MEGISTTLGGAVAVSGVRTDLRGAVAVSGVMGNGRISTDAPCGAEKTTSVYLQQIAAQSEKIEQLKTENAFLSGRLDEYPKLKQQIHALKGQVQALEGQVAEKEDQLGMLRSKAIAEKAAEPHITSDMHKKLTELERERTKIIQTVVERDRQINTLQEQNAHLRMECDQQKLTITNLQALQGEIEQQYDDAKMHIFERQTVLRKKLHQLYEKRNTALQAEIDNLRTTGAETAAEAERNLRTAAAEAERNAVLELETARLRVETAQLRSEITRLRHEVSIKQSDGGSGAPETLDGGTG